MKGKVEFIALSEKKGTAKKRVGSTLAIENFGLQGDAHGGMKYRQVSMLAAESLLKLKEMGVDVQPGDMGENIVIKGMDISKLSPGDRILFNESAVCEVTQIGKVCRDRCDIWDKLGVCSMSDEGIFMKVIKGGTINCGDRVVLQDD